MNYWYIRRPYEVFVDYDGHDEGQYARLLERAQRRLEGLVSDRKLDVMDAYLFPSQAKLHHHLIVRCKQALSDEMAQVFALYLGTDVFRACQNLMRRLHAVPNPDLLIVMEEPYPDFYRVHDHTCDCQAKHIEAVMEACPTATRLRRDARVARYFGKPVNANNWRNVGKVYPRFEDDNGREATASDSGKSVAESR